MTSGKAEFWRVLNASTNGFLALQVLSPGPQQLQVISLDGIPLTSPVNRTTVYLPPAGRAEFIVPALTLGTPSFFTTNGFNTGPIGDYMPGGHLASLVVGPGKFGEVHTAHPVPPPTEAPRFSGLASVTPTTTRSLYFSELNVGTNGPGQFFITEVGHKQTLFNPKNGAAITTKAGTVEDWTISNQSGEAHAFHIHQIHFLVTAINGVALTNSTWLTRLRSRAGRHRPLPECDRANGFPRSEYCGFICVPLPHSRSRGRRHDGNDCRNPLAKLTGRSCCAAPIPASCGCAAPLAPQLPRRRLRL